MQGSSNGPFATLLMLVPLVAVPLLAIFGVPQFSPLAASQSDENEAPKRENDIGLGEAARFADGDAPTATLGNGLRGGAPDIDASRRSVPRAFETDSDPFMNEANAATTPPAHEHHNSPNADANDEAHSVAGSENFAAEEQTNVDTPRRDRPAPGTRRSATTGDEQIAQSEEAALAMSDEELKTRPRMTLGRGRQQAEDPQQPAKRTENARARQLELDDADETSSASAASGRPTLGAPQRTPPSTKKPTQPRRHVENASKRIERRGPLTWKTAVHRLNDLGIHKYQMQPGQSAEDFHFSCSYNPTGNARVSRRFEAEASEPLKAVEKVLEQIETWQEEQEER